MFGKKKVEAAAALAELTGRIDVLYEVVRTLVEQPLPAFPPTHGEEILGELASLRNEVRELALGGDSILASLTDQVRSLTRTIGELRGQVEKRQTIKLRIVAGKGVEVG